jgi:hypothetical protein
MNAVSKKPLLAFHDNPETKTKYLARVKRHREAGDMTQEYWWDRETRSGCAVGCTIHGSDPEVYEKELGIPAALCWLESALHVRMREDRAEGWAEEFLAAITPGTELSLVFAHFMYWLLTTPSGPRFHCSPDDRHVLDVVASLYVRRINGDDPVTATWHASRIVAKLSILFAEANGESTMLGLCLFADSALMAPSDGGKIWDTLNYASYLMKNWSFENHWDCMADRLIALLKSVERESSAQHFLPCADLMAR